ncbi:MAG: cell envelope biogenesis protein TolA [SAR324 cluster bacterium]|nr:cell envelope biogenesis protein TolA [SAR324 cluster bacterium]
MTQDLALISVDIDPEVIFSNGGLTDILRKIEQEAKREVPDTSTPKGRKAIASLAYKVAQSKTVIDSLGKKLVEDEKARISKIDAERKIARDFLDQLKVEIRQPLTDWEVEEEKRLVAERIMAEIDAVWELAISENILFDRERELRKKELEALARERELRKKELEALAREQAEREKTAQEQREKLIREEAEERAKAVAAQELERKIKEAEAIARKEAEAIAAEAQRQKDLVEARAKDAQHRKEVDEEILKALVDGGVKSPTAKKILDMILSGIVPHVKITY